eukprot:COSAG01_NODE_1163_length_11454_cov_3.546808_1_plen_114_part_10
MSGRSGTTAISSYLVQAAALAALPRVPPRLRDTAAGVLACAGTAWGRHSKSLDTLVLWGRGGWLAGYLQWLMAGALDPAAGGCDPAGGCCSKTAPDCGSTLQGSALFIGVCIYE